MARDLGDDDEEKGLSGARTQAAPGGEAELDAMLASSAAQLAQMLEAGDGDQLDLLTGSPDVENVDAISTAANLVAKRRRGAGRPAGSRNRRTAEVFDVLAKLGHRDPLVTLSMIQTANTTALAAMLDADPVKVLAVQAKAASDLAQYAHAKKVKVEHEAQHLHVFMAQMAGGSADAGGKGLSIFGDGKANEINGDVVRLEDGASHDEAKGEQDQGDSG